MSTCVHAQSLGSFTCLARSPACTPVYLTAQCCIQRAALSLHPPLGSNASCLFTQASPCRQLLCCTTVLFKVLYCKIKNIFSVYFLCIICVQSIINLLQYSVANGVGWVPRLTFVGLTNVLSEQNSFVYRGLTLFIIIHAIISSSQLLVSPQEPMYTRY